MPKVTEVYRRLPKRKIFSSNRNMGSEYYKYYKHYTRFEGRDNTL